MCRITANRTVRPVAFKYSALVGKKQQIPEGADQHQQEQQQCENQEHPYVEEVQVCPSPSAEDLPRSTVCAICGVDTGSFNLNYGANTCLSCRAFFRRAIQKTRNPSFTCRFGGRCEITEETRRACKRCRFDQCVRAGMNAECVMDGSAIQARFSKYIQRRKGLDKKASTMAKLALEKERVRVDRETEKKRQRRQRQRMIRPSEEKRDLLKVAMKELMKTSAEQNKMRVETLEMPDFLEASSDLFAASPDFFEAPSDSVHSPISTLSSGQETGSEQSIFLSSANNSPHSGGMDHLDEDFADFFDLDLLPKEEVVTPDMVTMDLSEECESMPLFEDLIYTDEAQEEVVMMMKAKNTRKTWFNVSQEERFDDDVVARVVDELTQRKRLSTTLVEIISTKYEQMFRRFAFEQNEFLSLSEKDRNTLLSINIHLFVEYVFGKVLSSPNIRQQLQWLLLLEEPLVTEKEGSLRMIKVDDLHPHIVTSGLQEYTETAQTLNNPQVQFPCTGKMALICLFQNETLHSTLEAPGEIAHRRNLVYKWADWAHEIFNSASSQELNTIVEALITMANLSKSHYLTAEGEKILCKPEEANLVNQEQEEEVWVQNHLRGFDSTFDQISFGADFVKECVMNSFGVPLSKHFLPQGTRVWVSRFQQILLQHEEFSALSAEKQSQLWTSGPLAAFAIAKAKLESCKTGNEQFRIAFGRDDDAVLTEAFATHRRTPRLKRVLLRDWSKTTQTLDAATMDRLAELTAHLAHLLQTPEAFKLMTLLAMFGGLGAEDVEVVGVERKYLGALKRRVVGGISEADIRRALCDSKELSMILQRLCQAASSEILHGEMVG